MRRRRLIHQIFLSYLLIMLIPLAAVTLYATRSTRDLYLKQTAIDLQARAQLTQKLLEGHLQRENADDIDALVTEMGQKTGTRITVILPTGIVLGDSEEDPQGMDNHLGRPEISEALEGRVGSSVRYSNTLKRSMMYVAIPVMQESHPVSVIRTSVPLAALDETLHTILFDLLLGGLAVAALAAAVAFYLSRRSSQVLKEFSNGIERFGRGELDFRLPLPQSEELAGLVRASNAMADQLSQRIRTEIQQRGELEAVLFSMIEGVLAVDTEQRVVSFNQAAVKLLDFDPAIAKSRYLQEVVRNVNLQSIATEVLEHRKTIEREILLHHPTGEKYIQVHGTLLQGAKEEPVGALLVFDDMTRLRQLENIRREFVANVSHELKTPITSIKASVETLLEGALDKPKDAQRFLQIILRQADQLHAVIEDLLSLSRLERETERAEMQREEVPLIDTLRNAIQSCEPQAKEKGIDVHLDCDTDITAMINAPLLQQAVVNLLDNAIKYSERHTRVDVQVIREETEFLISVRDQGFGIETRHLVRIFERFYRVDKGRSRNMGGTGLGLAIVKHIAQAHGGRTSVQSNPGHGSVFSIHLPVPAQTKEKVKPLSASLPSAD